MITLGQGYSFGVLWNLKQMGFKGHEILKVLNETENAPQETEYLVCGPQWRQHLKSNTLPFHSREEALSFKWEPFLLSEMDWRPPLLRVFFISPTGLSLESGEREPLLRPPKILS